MSTVTQELEKIYKNFIEKELREICDEVLNKETYHHFGQDYIYAKQFTEAGHRFISDHNLPVEREFINKYLINQIKEKKLLDLKINKIGNRCIKLYNNYLFDNASSFVKNNNDDCTYVINCLRNFLNFLNIGIPSYFVEFEELKNLLSDLGISPSSQLAIFIEAVKTNYSRLNKKEFNFFKLDYEEMLKHKFKYISNEQIIDILKNNKIESFLDDKNPKLRKAQNELRDYLQDNRIDVTNIQKSCELLVETMHKKSRTEEDNKTINECMENLHFSDLTSRFFRYIDHQNEINNESSTKEKIHKDEKKGNIETKKVPKKQKSEAPKKQTSLNQAIREINKYFDLDNLELKEELSLDQIIYILSLMYSIEVEDNKIETFLREAMRTFKEFHPYAIYNQAYDKFVYLGNDNPEIKQHIEMIEYILSESNIFMCDEEKYNSTKKLMEEEINELMRIINGIYTYEIEEAKKLLKNSKNRGEK